AIDHDEPASWKPGGREHPIAGSGHIAAQCRAAGINERLGAGNERSGELHVAELVLRRIKSSPLLARRQIDRSRGKALLERRDQRFLPGLALELPGAEPDEGCERRKREHGGRRKAGSQAPHRRDGHGASPPVKRVSAALWWYCKAIRSPLTGRNGRSVVTR